MDLLPMLERLSNPEAYPNSVKSVELRQTHISVVCVTNDIVYKIKKPVKFSFLDFSSLEKRRFYCEREVELNRRLALDVYLGVVPIVFAEGRLRVDAPGEPIEWAVKMRRLPEAASLEQRLLRDEVGPQLIKLLARRVAGFHAAAPADSRIARYGSFDAVAKSILDNLIVGRIRDATLMDDVLFARLEKLTGQRLESSRALIDQRAGRGVPRDTHGDLHLDHVYVFPERLPPADLCIIDCIEFNEEFRYIDPIADVAFLVMDLKFHGRGDLARVLTDEYFDATGDSEGRQLLPLYVSYRAAVRAKVETLELAEVEIPEAERLLAAERARGHWLLALSELEKPFRRPCLLLVGGLPGTGKTTLARRLAEVADFCVIRSDIVRKELAGLSETSSSATAYQTGLYSTEWTERTYAECLRRAEELLQHGGRVIIDATFSQEAHRRRFLAAAQRLALPGLCLICQSDPEVIHRRLQERIGDASDADWKIYLAAAEKWEPASNRTAQVLNTIDSGRTGEFACEQAIQTLRNAELL